jgi:hypothetical protein
MSASSSTGCGIIEYDNTQDRANHIHSVWRDLRRDFAGTCWPALRGRAPLIGG